MVSPLLQKLSSRLYISPVNRNGVEYTLIRARNVSKSMEMLQIFKKHFCSCVDDDFIVIYVLVLLSQFLVIRKLMDELEMEMDDISKEQVNSYRKLLNFQAFNRHLPIENRKCLRTLSKTAWQTFANRWKKKTLISIRKRQTVSSLAPCRTTTRKITSQSRPAMSNLECPKKNWKRSSESICRSLFVEVFDC